MPDLRFYLKVSRPRFWIYVFGPYIVGLVAGAVTKGQFYDIRLLLFGLYFLFPANLLIYGVNDIFDYETDKLNEKKSEYETLVTPDKWHGLWLVIAILNLPFVVVAALTAKLAIFAFALFLFLSVYYSAPPVRAKARPLIDSLFNILYLMPGIFAFQMISGINPPWSLVVAGGLWTAAMHAFSAIPDIEADRKAGLSTIATTLGPTGTHLFCLVAYVASSALTYPYLSYMSVALGVIYAAMMIFSKSKSGREGVFGVYRFFPWVNAACGFAIFWYIAISKFFVCYFTACE